MGCDFCVNIGPLIVINNPPVNTVETHKSCCNEKCKNFHKHDYVKFCAECGSPIQEWNEPVTKPKRVDFYELFNESLVPADFENSGASTIILISNDGNKSREVGFQHFNLKYEEFQIFPKIEEITDSVEKFKKVFESELNKLKEIFGVSNVEVRYATVGTITC